MGQAWIIALLAALIAGADCKVGNAQSDWGSLEALRTGRAVAGPAGWLNWCFATHGGCVTASGPASLQATADLLALLGRVQDEVNGAITSQPEPPGRDLWRADAIAGDCEDFALAKRALLRTAGLPPGAVRLAMAALPNGERHAVVTVETDRGTLVLDNLRHVVVPMRSLDYAWLRLEGTDGRLEWQELGGSATDRRADGAEWPTATITQSRRTQ